MRRFITELGTAYTVLLQPHTSGLRRLALTRTSGVGAAIELRIFRVNADTIGGRMRINRWKDADSIVGRMLINSGRM